MVIALKSLAMHVKTECEVLGRLITLLREEQRALVSGEIEALALYSEPKSRLLLELSQSADERTQLLSANGLASSASGMEQLLRMLQGNGTAIADWERLIADTRTAKQLNEINGSLIATRMRGTQQALSVLLSAAQIPGTYAADGSTVGLRGTHRLAVV